MYYNYFVRKIKRWSIFKKEYLYDFIEKGYGKKEKYNLAVSQLIKRLRASGNMEMADVIRNIQIDNSISLKTNRKKVSVKDFYKQFQNYDNSIIEKARLIIKGYQSSIINSALLFGDPGTGKTYFARQFCKSSKLKFIIMDLSMILDFRFGESIKKLENFIEKNKDQKQVIFFDEADSIFSKRGNARDVFETSRIITTMLQLLDQPRKALIIFSTNLIKEIDKAIIRRFDIKINFNKELNKDLKMKILEEFLLDWNIVLSIDELGIVQRFTTQTNFNISDLKLISKRIAINKKLKNLSNQDFKKMIKSIIKEIEFHKISTDFYNGER